MSQEIKTIRVELGKRGYDILIGSGALEGLGHRLRQITDSKRAFLISNPFVYDLYGKRVEAALSGVGVEAVSLLVPDGEEAKSLESACHLYGELVKNLANRHDPIIALGGGVIGDLAGFVASTFMRGLPLIQIPTTLLAQVDSSVGGKTAVNLPEAKNMVGTFYQPKLVIIDTDTLKSLEQRELKAGLAEVIKCAFLLGGESIHFLCEHIEEILSLESAPISKAILICCDFKARIVEEDEQDLGQRAILNYGHTIGHALETIFGYAKYRHGEAIAIGMMAAAKISYKLGILDKEALEIHEKLISKAGLPTILPNIPKEKLTEQILLDKKGSGEQVNFILLEGIGHPVIKPILVNQAVALLYD